MTVTFNRKRPFEIHDQRMVRLFDPETGRYLHLSGEGTTTIREWPWLGYKHQADTLKRKARETGKPWPYIIEERDA